MEPPLDGVPSSPVKRLLAALIDSVIVMVLVIPKIVAIDPARRPEDPITPVPQVLIGVGVVIPLAYILLIIWLTGAKGFSFGKLIIGLRITRTHDGRDIGFLRSAGRWVLYSLIPWIMALSIFLDPKNPLRGFHDRVVDSVVVDIKTGRNPFVKPA